MDVRGYVIYGCFVTVDSLIRISSGTIFPWNFMAPWLQDAGEGTQSASKAQLLFNHLASQELALQKLWTHYVGADLLGDWMSLVGKYLPQDRIEVWRLPGREPRAAFSPFHIFSLLHKLFSKPVLEITRFVLMQCSFHMKKNSEEFFYF